jgi:hypothetical protein
MTIIAIKNKILAVDSAIFVDQTYKGSMVKFAKGGDYILAIAGDATTGANALSNFRKGYRIKKIAAELDGNTTGVLLHHSGDIFIMENRHILPLEKTRLCAEGAGGDIALGAMLAGASATEAAVFACQHNAFCRGPIYEVSFKIPTRVVQHPC